MAALRAGYTYLGVRQNVERSRSSNALLRHSINTCAKDMSRLKPMVSKHSSNPLRHGASRWWFSKLYFKSRGVLNTRLAHAMGCFESNRLRGAREARTSSDGFARTITLRRRFRVQCVRTVSQPTVPMSARRGNIFFCPGFQDCTEPSGRDQ